MHPVRPGGTRTTDSSSPSLACSRASGERAGDGATLSTCGWEEPLGMTRTTLATRRLCHRRTNPGECRSIRPSGVPLTCPRVRPTARTPRALSPTLFSFGPKGGARGACRDLAPVRKSVTPKALLRFCHRSYSASTKPMLLILVGPPARPWQGAPGISRHPFGWRDGLDTSGAGPCGPWPAVPCRTLRSDSHVIA